LELTTINFLLDCAMLCGIARHTVEQSQQAKGREFFDVARQAGGSLA
jgi:hypothetical protein